MLGKYKIRVRKRKLEYNLEVKRNITILTGDSAIGKTELINAIRDYDNLGSESGIKLECNKRCTVLEGKRWERDLRDISNCIVFIDEKSKFVATDEFANAIKFSDNYYVIVTRQKLTNLPFSINEIYTLTCDGISENGIYNNQKKLYENSGVHASGHIERIVTEDSKAGYQFFNAASKIYGFVCTNAGGKDQIVDAIASEQKERTLLIVDGAAFGPEIRDVARLIEEHSNYMLYAPESFEWLLLQSKTFKWPELEDILENTYNYADSRKYFSWERYFVSLLKEIAGNNELLRTYTKSRLNEYFLNEMNIRKIVSSMEIHEMIE